MRFGFVGLGRAARLYHLPAVRRSRCQPWEASTRPSSNGLLGPRDGHPAFSELKSCSIREAGRRRRGDTAAPHADLCVQALEAGSHSSARSRSSLRAPKATGCWRPRSRRPTNRGEPPVPRKADLPRSARGDPRRPYGRLAFCQLWQLMNLAPWDEPTEWRAGDVEQTLLEGGVHLVDLMIVLFGEPPEAVSASHSAGYHARPTRTPSNW